LNTAKRLLRLNRLRVLVGKHVAYDEEFHEGVNIIRGQNGSGKSTIADFIFFGLGGEFDAWKEAAGKCTEVQCEIATTSGLLTLRRELDSKTSPANVFFGSIDRASKHALEGWERFPLRRQGGRESYSQVLFRSISIPEAQSEGASNITAHQLLRLCYSDQRTPAARLFRFEPFDTQSIREAVGDLICGINNYEAYDLGLRSRDLQKKLDAVSSRLNSILQVLPAESISHDSEWVLQAVSKLKSEKEKLLQEIEQVDEVVEVGDVKEYLAKRKAAQSKIAKSRSKIRGYETDIHTLLLDIQEIEEYQSFLGNLGTKLELAEKTLLTVGSIEFSHCPACGSELGEIQDPEVCVICRQTTDQSDDLSRYNRVRLDLEIQKRESKHLLDQKAGSVKSNRTALRRLRRDQERMLSDYDMKYSGAKGPREEFLAERTSGVGRIEAEIEHLLGSLEIAEQIESLQEERADLRSRLENMEAKRLALQKLAMKRRSEAFSQISIHATSILQADCDRQEEFADASRVQLNFGNDAISVDHKVNFAESSNVFLKNTAVLSILLAALRDEMFFHPKFLLIDNVEDKGMEEERSHLFQKIIVERSTEEEEPFQIIFTTSMMNPELELDEYVIGPSYTKDNKSLRLP